AMVIRSLIKMQQADLGFAPASLFSVSIDVPRNRYASNASRTAIVGEIFARLRQMPGVRAAAVAGNGIGQFSFRVGQLEIEGEPRPASPSSSFIEWNPIETGYLRTMGTPLVAGTMFTDTSS